MQFGLDYGVSNVKGKVSAPETKAILDLAAENGIDILDTAASYGTSESVIGAMLPDASAFKIVTKTPVLKGYTESKPIALYVRETLLRSLERMRTNRVYGLLVHHVDDLTGPWARELRDCLLCAKDEGLVEKIGVSVYDAPQIDAVLGVMAPDIVQLPLNPFDQRLIASRHLERLKLLGVEIHARSIFLQGLLLLDPMELPAYFRAIGAHVAAYGRYLEENGLSRLEGALCFVEQRPEVDVALVGVTSQMELMEIMKSRDAVQGCNLDFAAFALHDEAFVNPSNWRIEQ